MIIPSFLRAKSSHVSRLGGAEIDLVEYYGPG